MKKLEYILRCCKNDDKTAIVKWFEENKEYDLINVLFKIVSKQTEELKYKVKINREHNLMNQINLYDEIMDKVEKEIKETNDIKENITNLITLIRITMDSEMDNSKGYLDRFKILKPFLNKFREKVQIWFKEKFFIDENKITLSEFWESKENLAIHCDTEEKARILCKAFAKMGKKWCNGKSYLTKKFFQFFGEESCYTNDGHITEIGNCYRLDDSFENVLGKYTKVYEFEEVLI